MKIKIRAIAYLTFLLGSVAVAQVFPQQQIVDDVNSLGILRWNDFEAVVMEEEFTNTETVDVPTPRGQPRKRSSNPITPFGITIRDFLDFGMVHVIDFEEMLSQASGTEAANVYVKKIYTRRKFTAGANNTPTAVPVSLELIKDLGSDEKESEEAEEEADAQPDEEETDLSKLASRTQRG